MDRDIIARLDRIINSYPEPPQERIHLEIPLRCKAKARPRRGKTWGGRKVWYNPTREHEENIASYVSKQMRQNGWQPLKGKLRIRCRIYLKGKQRSDWDNYGKTISDSLQGVGDYWPLCYFNDIQIKEATVEIGEHARENRIIVDIEQIGEFEEKLKKGGES